MLAIAAAAAFAIFRDYGLGWDDYVHAEYGDLMLAFYASGFTDRRALSWVNLYMYGGGFDLLAAAAAKILPFTLFETRRLIGALVGMVGLVAVWRTARRIGGPIAGLMALVLLGYLPALCRPCRSSTPRTAHLRSRWRSCSTRWCVPSTSIRGRASRASCWSASAPGLRSAPASWARSARFMLWRHCC